MSNDAPTIDFEKPTIDFDKMDGLVPGIVQDATSGEMLMLGFLNPVSYAKTLESGFVTFWSRTRPRQSDHSHALILRPRPALPQQKHLTRPRVCP